VFAEPCSGTVDISLKHDVSTTTGHESMPVQMIVSKLGNGMLQGVVSDAYEKYYLNVTATKDSELSHDVTYQIHTSIYNPTEEIPKEMQAGNNGLIHWELDGKTVKLNWTAPEYIDGSEISEGKIKYYIYSTESQNNFLLNTVCQMRHCDNKDKDSDNDKKKKKSVCQQEVSTHDTSIEFENEENENLYVNIVAKIKLDVGEKKKAKYYVPYS
jgi:hypothetical protein